MGTIRDIQKYIDKAHATEDKYGIPRGKLTGVLYAESRFREDVISGKKKSTAGAIGIGQFMPLTAKEYGIDPTDPMQSIEAAGKYLSSSYKTFGNWDDAIMSYNMGVQGLKNVKSGKKQLPKETANYIVTVNNYTGDSNKGTTNVTNLQETDYTPIFAQQEVTYTPNVEEEETVDKDVEELTKENQEREFVKEYQASIVQQELPQLQEQVQQQAPPQYNLTDIYNQVSQFVDTPIAQRGGTYNNLREDEKNNEKPMLERIPSNRFEIQGGQTSAQLRPKKEAQEVGQQGGFQYSRKNQLTNSVDSKENRQLDLLTREIRAQEQDKRELRAKGQIKNPQSNQYKKTVQKTQPTVSQDNRTDSERNMSAEAMKKVNDGSLFLERPLIYAANPEKLLGDIGVRGMETSEADRERIMLNRYNPYQSRGQQFQNNLEQGLGYVPEASVNVGLSMIGMENPTAGRLLNEAINPLAGIGKNQINKAGKFLTEETFLKNAYKLNPKAFKPNSNSFYRQVDGETFKEAVESGVIRGKQNVNTNSGVNEININKAFGEDAYYNKGSLYYKNNTDLPYLFESKLPEDSFIPKVNGRTRKLTRENTNVRVTKEPTSIKDPSITTYKKDWLQGYKQIKQQGGYTDNERAFLQEMQSGGVIKDQQGQRKYPFKVTEIQGNTMATDGYGNIPLLVKPNVGKSQIIEANSGDYKFEGATKFTEFPITEAEKQFLKAYNGLKR